MVVMTWARGEDSLSSVMAMALDPRRLRRRSSVNHLPDDDDDDVDDDVGKELLSTDGGFAVDAAVVSAIFLFLLLPNR